MMSSFYFYKDQQKLGTRNTLQQPENCSLTPTETTTVRVWKHFHGKETWMELIGDKEEKRCSARKILRNKSATKTNLFQHDIFHNQKVPVGDVFRFSRHFVAETRGPAKLSAVPTTEVKPSEEIRPTGLEHVETHFFTVVLEKAETDRGQQERQEREEEIRSDAQEDMCTPPSCQTWQSIIQTEEHNGFDDIAHLAHVAHLAEELVEDLEESRKDESVLRRFVNWLNDVLKERNMTKITKTRRREQEEGDNIYRTSYMARLMTRAEREQQKRWKLIFKEKQRQHVEKLLDTHWEVQRYQKEALRLKEEERYEKWAAEHGLGIHESSPGQPKKGMSKWEKRFLRVKEFYCH